MLSKVLEFTAKSSIPLVAVVTVLATGPKARELGRFELRQAGVGFEVEDLGSGTVTGVASFKAAMDLAASC